MQTLSKKFPKLLVLLIVVLLFTALFCACNDKDDTTVVKQVNLTVEGGYIGQNPFTTSSRVYAGVTVTVTAVVRENEQFDCWVDGSGTAVSTSNPYRFTITQDTSLTAFFKDATPRRIEVDGGYINDDTQCIQAQFATGTSVTVSAVVPDDKVFSHWVNAQNVSVSQDNPYAFVLSEDTSLTAVLLDKEELLIAVVGGYIGEDPTCTSASFYTGDTVRVVATPPQGKRFVAWRTQSGAQLSDEAEYSFTLIKAVSLVAVFEPIKHTVKLENGYINGDSDCTELSVDYGTSVTLYASEQVGATFIHWIDDNGEEISQQNPYIVEVVSDLSYTAVYQKSTVNVSVSGGIIGTSGTQTQIEYGTQVTVTAQAPQGKVFESWLINGTNTSTVNPYTFTVTENMVFIARFIDETVMPDPITYTLSVTNGSADVSGAIEENTRVTLTANEDTSERMFLHWEVNGENVGSNRQYSFNIARNTRAIAVYKSIITLSVIDGETSVDEVYDGGDTVRLSASVTNPEKPFLCWYSDEGKIISTDRDCEFVINKSTVVRAIYADKQREDGKVNVVIYGGEAYTYVNNAKGESLGREFQISSSTTVYLTSDKTPSSAVSVVGTIFKPFASSGNIGNASANQLLPIYANQGDLYIVYSYTNSYAVTVENGKHANGQSGRVIYSENSTVTATADNINNKVFEYWTLNGEYYSDSSTVEWIATSNATLTAVYSNLYTVNVNGGGVIKDSEPTSTSTQVKNGDVVTVTVTSEDTLLKTFRRWVNHKGEVLSSQRDYTFKVSENMTVIAEYLYGYTVSVVNGTIDGIESGIYTQDTAHTIKAAVLEGKRFRGWTANGINVANATETMIIVITQDVVFEAVYYDEWTVTKTSADAFIIYGNEEVDFVRVIDGRSVTIGAKAKDGYYFDGWNITTNSNVIKISADHPAIREENGRYYYVYIVSASCTITPIYSPIITVTIKNEDAADGERVVKSREGDTIVLTASTSDPAKPFRDWMIGGSYFAQNPYIYTVGADNITITARYNSLYKLTLENGVIVGGEFDGQRIGYFAYNTQVEISASPEQGYRFDHWRNDSGILSDLGETFTARINSDINYYAEVVRVYTVTVKDKASDSILHTKQVDANGNFSYTAPQKDGARFGYWLVNGEQISGEQYSIINITSDITIEVVYILLAQITVQNIDGRGTSSTTYTRDYGSSFSTAERTTPSTISGMTFLGWSVNGVLDTTANGDTYIIDSVSGDVVLAPVYEMLYSQTAAVGYDKSISNMQNFAAYYQNGGTRNKAFVAPGLSTNESFVIQGIDYSETLNWTFVTGYISPDNNIAKHSMIFVIDMSQKDSVSGNYGKLIKEIFLENESGAVYTGHAGGLAVSENNLWISNSKKLFYISLDTIVNAKSSSVIRFAGSVAVPVNSSYCTFADGILWVGEFEYASGNYNTDSTHHNSSNSKLTAWTVGYILNESGAAGYDATTGLKLESGVATPDYVLWHIEKIQGMTIAGNKVVLSQSYGRTNNSTIYIYKNEVYGRNAADSDGTVTINGKSVPYWLLDSATQTVSAPSMTEDIAVCYEKQTSSINAGKYYVMIASESASYKYNGAESTKSKNPTDLVWYLEIAQ